LKKKKIKLFLPIMDEKKVVKKQKIKELWEK
jgi:hypothetical protein